MTHPISGTGRPVLGGVADSVPGLGKRLRAPEAQRPQRRRGVRNAEEDVLVEVAEMQAGIGTIDRPDHVS